MVTILVTTYNDSKYLAKNLKSCLAQNIEKEILVVDDCSTEPFSPKIEKILKDKNIRVIRRETNGGLSAARNTGVSEAKYDLIIPLDADDFFISNAVKQLVSMVDDDHHIFYGNTFDNGPTCNRWLEPPSKNITKKDFLCGNPLYCSSLFKKEVWEKNGGYTVRPHAHYEDYNFWAKAFKCGFKFKYCPVNVYQHTWRNDSMLQKLHKSTGELKKLAIEGIF